MSATATAFTLVVAEDPEDGGSARPHRHRRPGALRDDRLSAGRRAPEAASDPGALVEGQEIRQHLLGLAHGLLALALALGVDLVELLLHLHDARHEALNRLGHRVGQVTVVDIGDADALALEQHRAARVADHGGVLGHVADDDAAGADLGVVAHGHRAQHLGPGAEHHVVAHGGMPLAGLLARAAQGDSLLHGHVVADLRGLSDHDSGAVVDEQAVADARAGVDLDAGEKAVELADPARHDRYAHIVEPVSYTHLR